MSRTQLGIQGSSRLRRVLGLGLSGAALVGLVYFEGVSARAEGADAQDASALADEEWDDDEAEAAQSAVPTAIEAPKPKAPEPNAAKPKAPAPVVLAKADIGAADATAAAMPTEPEPAEPEATLIVVPDLKGMTLRKARKELEAVGLKLSVRDEWGDKVARDEYRYYKVRSQKIDAGAKVEAGSWVRVKARERYQISQGY